MAHCTGGRKSVTSADTGVWTNAIAARLSWVRGLREALKRADPRQLIGFALIRSAVLGGAPLEDTARESLLAFTDYGTAVDPVTFQCTLDMALTQCFQLRPGAVEARLSDAASVMALGSAYVMVRRYRVKRARACSVSHHGALIRRVREAFPGVPIAWDGIDDAASREAIEDYADGQVDAHRRQACAVLTRLDPAERHSPSETEAATFVLMHHFWTLSVSTAVHYVKEAIERGGRSTSRTTGLVIDELTALATLNTCTGYAVPLVQSAPTKKMEPRLGIHSARIPVLDLAAVDVAATVAAARLASGWSGRGSTAAWIVGLMAGGAAVHSALGIRTPLNSDPEWYYGMLAGGVAALLNPTSPALTFMGVAALTSTLMHSRFERSP